MTKKKTKNVVNLDLAIEPFDMIFNQQWLRMNTAIFRNPLAVYHLTSAANSVNTHFEEYCVGEFISGRSERFATWHSLFMV